MSHGTAFISGSSRGIGLAAARVLAKLGHPVVVSGRTAADVEKAVSSLRSTDARAQGFVGDLTDERQIARALDEAERLGPLEIVVANLGSGKAQAGWDVSLEEFRRVFDLNFFASVALCTRAARRMKQGSIVAVSSIAGLESLGAPIPYAAAKGALLAFTKGLSDELAPRGIRVNALSPGNILFEGGRWEEKRQADPAGVDRMIQAKVPLARFGKPEEIADAVAFLVQNPFMTGQNLIVDGGQTRRMS